MCLNIRTVCTLILNAKGLNISEQCDTSVYGGGHWAHMVRQKFEVSFFLPFSLHIGRIESDH